MKPAEITAAAQRAIGLQQAEQTTLARLRAGEKLPDINGTNARIRAAVKAASGG